MRLENPNTDGRPQCRNTIKWRQPSEKLDMDPWRDAGINTESKTDHDTQSHHSIEFTARVFPSKANAKHGLLTLPVAVARPVVHVFFCADSPGARGYSCRQYHPHLHWWIGVAKSGVASAIFLNRNREPVGAWNRYLKADKILTDNQWHAIAFVRNGVTSENRLYVDGQLEDKVFVAYGDDGFSAYTTPVNIGWMGKDAQYQYKGMVDEIAMYDTALPQWFIHDRYHADARYGSSQTDP